jgi:hypothetical protein
MRKPTRLEKRISGELGVSFAGLCLLSRAAADPKGRASGPGFGHGSGGSRRSLEQSGLVTSRLEQSDDRDPYTAYITGAGREIVSRARRLGF